MTNTMADLRREVARRLRDTLHGREIDTMEKGMPELEHMLGIVTIGAISTPEAIKGSLLDPDHTFWDSYYEDVTTRNAVEREVKSAIHSLQDDGLFQLSTPYGEEAGIWYCEVDEIDTSSNEMMTSCADCGTPLSTEPELQANCGRYAISFSIDCPECDLSAVFATNLIRQ